MLGRIQSSRRWLLLGGLLSLGALAPGTWADSLTLTVPSGLSTIGNPFNIGSNVVAQILTNVPEGTQVFKFDPSGQRWEPNLFQFGAWVHPEQTLGPGEGAFIRNPTNSFSITLTGVRPANFLLPIHSGYNLVSVPEDGTNNLSPMDNDYILPFNSNLQGVDVPITYVEGAGWFSSTGQVFSPVHAGEALIYHRGTNLLESLPAELIHAVFLNNYAPGSAAHSPIISTYGCFANTSVVELYGGPESDPSTYMPDGDPIPLLPSTNATTFIDTHFDAVRVLPTNWFWYQLRVSDQSSSGLLDTASGIFTLDGSSLAPQILPSLNIQVGPLSPFYSGPPDPATNEVFEGQPAQFSILALGLGTYTFKWQRQTAPNTWVDIPGTDSITFTIPSVQNTDAGLYRAVSSFECASGATLPGLLVVLDRPSLQASLFSGGTALTLDGSGPAGFSYQIEASEDLAQWDNFAVVTNGPASWQLAVTNTPEFSQRYFRLRVLP